MTTIDERPILDGDILGPAIAPAPCCPPPPPILDGVVLGRVVCAWHEPRPTATIADEVTHTICPTCRATYFPEEATA